MTLEVRTVANFCGKRVGREFLGSDNILFLDLGTEEIGVFTLYRAVLHFFVCM